MIRQLLTIRNAFPTHPERSGGEGLCGSAEDSTRLGQHDRTLTFARESRTLPASKESSALRKNRAFADGFANEQSRREAGIGRWVPAREGTRKKRALPDGLVSGTYPTLFCPSVRSAATLRRNPFQEGVELGSEQAVSLEQRAVSGAKRGSAKMERKEFRGPLRNSVDIS